MRAVLLLLFFAASWQHVSAQLVCAVPGKDGPGTLSGVINTYYPGEANANAGATSITIGTPTGASATIEAGDLLLVIQMQNADIDSDNDDGYGDGVAGGNASGSTNLATSTAGRYEYVVATTAAGATVGIRGAGAGGGLVNSYTNAAFGTQGQRRFQVVRVPQYASATLGALTAAPWNGRTGGILAFDVAGQLNLGGGTANVNGLGFRGGGAVQLAGDNSGGTNSDYRNLSTRPFHGSKGEGIAGTPRFVYDSVSGTVQNTGVEGYPNGSFARGAPGNAGGGGTDGNVRANDENSGGGGGANGGAGGRGGNTWNSNRATGGHGGSAFASVAAAGRMVLGGGGGAGTRNNSSGAASSGGAGGGIVMIRAGSFTGSGTISANGADGIEPINDGGGGGGAGGSVLVAAVTGGLGTLNINARGGRGSDADANGSSHGPGGGGGGGFIALNGAATTSVAGGAHGVTTNANIAFNSTDGASGLTASITLAQIPGANAGAQCLPILTVTKTTSTATVNNTPSGATATYTIVVSNAATRGSAIGLSLSDTLPTGFTYASTGTVNTAGNATRTSVSNPTAGDAAPVWGIFTIPGGGSVTLTFTVNIAADVSGTKQNPATATYSDPVRTTTTGTAVANYNSASSTGEDVNVVAPPHVTLCKTVTGQPCPPPVLAAQLVGTEVTYIINFTNDGGRAASSLIISDKIPVNTEFKLGSVVYNAGNTGLAAPVVEFTTQPRNADPNVEDPPSPWVVYTPPGASGTYDSQITYVRFRFATGNLSPGTSGSVSFTVRIK
ncbi:MAG TPA: hypothetical protein VGV59_07245 [Pyrinomonadaceae bacterium]|nr:hypothetical protein [Pyrinomonadaceae bacterium]